MEKVDLNRNKSRNSFHFKKNAFQLLFLLFIVMGSIIFVYFPINYNARAVLISPRLGLPVQGPRTFGQSLENLGLDETKFSEGYLEIMVGVDPVESIIPNSWKSVNKWLVALDPAIIPSADSYMLKVDKIKTAVSSNVLFGPMDVTPLYPSALKLYVKVPNNLPPLVYNLIVSYGISADEFQEYLSNNCSDTPKPGSWMSFKGSGSIYSIKNQFILKEPSCVSLPWYFDAKSSESSYKKPLNPVIGDNLTGWVNPFTIIHVTDTHWEKANSEWTNQLNLFFKDMDVIAPDIIALSGDLVDNPEGSLQSVEDAYYDIAKSGNAFVITNGNHDQYLLAPWRTYFGPTAGTCMFDDVSIIEFDTTLPLGTGELSWINEQANKARREGPTFLMGHYPLEPTYFGGGWIGVSDILVKNNLTAYLTGHTHDDLILNINKAMSKISSLENIDDLSFIDDLINESFQEQEHLKPISQPQMIVTRTAAKTGRAYFDPNAANLIGFNMSNYAGYRKITIQNNLALNYTYDYNGDGVREPQISTPNGRFNVSIVYDDNVGESINAGANWTLINNMTEDIPAARALITLPNINPSNPQGNQYIWSLSDESIQQGAYIRAMVANSTHTIIDARVFAPALIDVSLRFIPHLIT